jgi:general secretion pathway protein I
MKLVRPQSRLRRDLRIERRGLTLLEMLLAASILAMSLAVLARQNGVGVRAALRSQLETEAAVLCQSQLNRLLAEKASIDTIPERPLTDAGSKSHRWMWSALVEPSSVPELRLVTVTVFAEGIHREISTVKLSRLVPTETQSSLQNIAGGRSR